jgi:hypothetical protein
MAKNSYFNYRDSERRLMEDLAIEAIKIYGEDFTYIVRESISRDDILGEDKNSKFKDSATVEMFVKNYEGREGSNVYSRFGIELKDRMILTVSKRRFEDVVSSLYNDVKRPREGDLIYAPKFGRFLMEIIFVEEQVPYFQGNQLACYEITAQTFKFEMESIETGITEIDTIQDEAEEKLTYIDISGVYGSFLANETVYVGATLSDASFTATVTNWSSQSPNTLYLKDVSGSVTGIIASVIKGTESGATANVDANLGNTANYITTDPFGSNDVIRRESRTIIDFSEVDPFSEGNY